MQQFQSLQRLLIFYALTLLIMLSLYYVTIFLDLEAYRQQHSVDIFSTLQHDLVEHAAPTNPEIKKILDHHFFDGISYQLVFMLPSGQTYIHRYTHPDADDIPAVTFPTNATPVSDNRSVYTLTAHYLTGTIMLDSGHQVYVVLQHQPFNINWLSYRYWLPLMTAIVLFIMALLYALKRRANWEQLLLYTDNLSDHAKEAYTPPPFIEKKSTSEFLRLGHALSRISYQINSNHRRIKTLSHRLERLVDQAPLPMLMIMRHGQISFFNQRFEQVFATSLHNSVSYQLTDFVSTDDEPTQQLLQKLAVLRVTRTLIVYGLANKQAYQLHITPWFGEHGQVHGFTALLNNINESENKVAKLQLQNQQLQQQLDDHSKLRSIIGHELRTPIDTVIGILEFIDPDTLSAKQQKTLNKLIQSSYSVLSLLNDMLDTTQTASNETNIVSEPVDIYKLGQHVSDLMVGDTRRQGLELLYFCAPECPRLIDTDNKRLRQILLSLLDNTLKLTTVGYVMLSVEPINEARLLQKEKYRLMHITKTTPSDNPQYWVRFSIKSIGMAIESTQHHQLLTYFNQKDNYTGLNSADIELGLTTANSFAHLLGGFIEFESTHNKNDTDQGSAFHLYLPCRRPNYQPIYHLNPHLAHIHLIAIVNQTVSTEHLQHLCQHLSISVSIYTATEIATLPLLVDQLAQNTQTLAPVLLLDYEYYEGSTLVSLDSLSRLLSDTSLPKILFSMKPERRIPSTLLDQCRGFLSKPLDLTLMLSELLRVTLPARQALKSPSDIQSDDNSTETDAHTTIDETITPLILVVEDSLTNQKITCKILAKLGYRSVVAEDGQQALDLLQVQRQDIALILMDCRMPVMDGLQATQFIRMQGDDIPIVALTANTTEKDRAACIQVGMDEFLSKPIDKKKLQNVLDTFINRL